MNEPTNAPMLPPPAGPSAWVSVWRDALTRPSEETFARIAQSPNAKLSTGLLWVFLGSLVNFFVISLIQGALIAQMMQSSDPGGQGLPNMAGGGFLTAICGAPIGAVMQTVIFAILMGIVQFLAKMFGGRGTFDQLVYTMASIVAPFSLVSAGITLLSAIPIAGYCFGILGFGLALYVLVLQVMAVKGVNQFGWGQAIGSLLLPVVAIACCFSIVLFGIFQALGPQLQEIFNSITTPVPVP